jgi:hypothetical protein
MGGFSHLLGKVKKLAKGKGGKFGKVALSIALGLCAVLLIATIANFVLCAIEKDGFKNCYGGGVYTGK